MLNHLDAMGITVYRPRVCAAPSSDADPPLPAQPLLCYTLLHGDKPVGHIILDAIDATPEKQVEIDELLDAMLRAVKLRRGTAIDTPNKSEHETALILTFGAKAKDSVKNTKFQTIATHHPLDILENPALKRDTWNTLKPIASRVWD